MPPDDRLGPYRDKRDAARTPEPMGGGTIARPGLFVVHLHDATNRHYDLRLEHNGTLWSWAVPKGPSLDPEVKRLAMHVEDHPLEYGDFEGVIPEGSYGAGPSILWDRGRFVAIEDLDAGLRDGKLLFDLYGHKLRGRFTLVRTTRSPKDWLLIKKPDAGADPKRVFSEKSVVSGLGLDELRRSHELVAALTEELAARGLPRRDVDPASVRVMLAETAPGPSSDPAWIYELKYDGYRLLAAKHGSQARLFYRSGREATPTWPEIAGVMRALPYPGLILDTEVVVPDERGHPSFQRLQGRGHLTRKEDAERAAIIEPVTCFAFDLLAICGFDLRDLPLVERKALLRRVVPTDGAVRYADHVEGMGEALFAQVQSRGLEGVMAKKADAPYRAGRHATWMKMPADRLGSFAVVGYSLPKGSRAGLGALHLAVRDADQYRWAGKVGTGFSTALLEDLRRRLDADVVKEPVCVAAPDERDAVWVTPKLVVRVRFKAWTDDDKLRLPVFEAVEDDADPERCRRPEEAGDVPEPAPEAPEAPDVAVSNRDKVFFPEHGLTKGDLVDYYVAVAPFLLPYLQDRPLVLVRYPDGIHGKSFFQKDAPRWAPDWLRTETLWSDHGEREIHYFVAEDARALAFLANLGAIPLHVWASRVSDPGRPDWVILDLDPKGAPFTDVVRIAQVTKALCDEIGLPVYAKTSGSSGIHCLVPLGARYSFEQARLLAELLGRVVVGRCADVATMVRTVEKRDGKVYVDTLQNGQGKLIVAPLSVREKPGAPVSVPLDWDEVNNDLRLSDHTIRTVPARLASRGDPLAAVLSDAPDLIAVLSRLSERLSKPGPG
jgi:bifunctional non-homologous end joining protein LigD